mmetsp:Transcript_14764/g.44331  ORF Transcript_14764/g.44331 Transcript_14764/m.44331 type:complete len:1041 (-) Transcript_14764:96-3218(-)
MSTDNMTLEAICVRTAARRLRYVELVTLPAPPVEAPKPTTGGEEDGKQAEDLGTQVFFCIAEHAIFFVRRSLGGMYPSESAGEIFLASVVSLVEDENNCTDLLINLNENRPSDWKSPKLYINCQHREKLANYLQVAWQTDVSWRVDEVRTLPRTKGKLRVSAPVNELRMRPFRFYQEVRHEGYVFFIKGHRDHRTGEFKGYEDRSKDMHSGAVQTFRDQKRFVTLHIQMWEEKSIMEYERRGLDNIRWLAMEQKQDIAMRHSGVLVISNSGYQKKMNLANDLAQWTGWMTHMRSSTHVIIVIFLRRRYIPPALESLQDMCVTLECPLRELKRVKDPVSEQELLVEAMVAADSASPVVENCTQVQTIYRDFVQSRLDALYYDEDTMSWLRRMLDLKPKPRHEARQFMKSILRILQEENALSSPDLIADPEIGDDVKFFREPMDVVQELVIKHFGNIRVDMEEDAASPTSKKQGKKDEDMLLVTVPGGDAEELVKVALGHDQQLPSGYKITYNTKTRQPGMRPGAWEAKFQPDDGGRVENIKGSQRSLPRGLPDDIAERDASIDAILEVYHFVKEDSRRRGARNAFCARIAKYFAYCVDGVILGKRFTIQDITSPFIVTQRSQDKLNDLLLFLLHMRPKDMNQPFRAGSLKHMLSNPNIFTEYTFNDRVMQAMIELRWIDKQLRGAKEKEGAMSLEYAKFLARVLLSRSASANLKAAVCRQIMGADQKSGHFAVLLPAVLELMDQPSAYIKTYATVTLVNMSSNQESVKHAIMGGQIARLCTENLHSQDDDLVRYTLVLLTQLTKNPHHRSTMASRNSKAVFGKGKKELDRALLDMLTHIPCMESKYETIGDLASVIGQLCNDHEMFALMCKPEYHILDSIQSLLEAAPSLSRVRSKLMFVLKQFCSVPFTPGKQEWGYETDPKDTIGPRVLPLVIAEIEEYLKLCGDNDDKKGEMARRLAEDRRGFRAMYEDCTTNAILLLVNLSTSVLICDKLHKKKFLELLHQLTSTKLGVNETLAPRIETLRLRIDSVARAKDTGEKK